MFEELIDRALCLILNRYHRDGMTGENIILVHELKTAHEEELRRSPAAAVGLPRDNINFERGDIESDARRMQRVVQDRLRRLIDRRISGVHKIAIEDTSRLIFRMSPDLRSLLIDMTIDHINRVSLRITNEIQARQEMNRLIEAARGEEFSELEQRLIKYAQLAFDREGIQQVEFYDGEF